MKTQAYPYQQIAADTYEIGEFDCASIFLLIGSEKAMLIDTGIGVGDLQGFVGTLTDKPLMVCYTHAHPDHTGGASPFPQAYLHSKDMPEFATGGIIGLSVDGRQGYVRMIAAREKGDYPYNLDVDVSEWGPCPQLLPLEDGQVVDLGGRKVQVVACPGHSPGSIAFLDENTRLLFMGDACNCVLHLGGGGPGKPTFTSVETALFYLKRLRSLKGSYDWAYNGHYDFRKLGEPLAEDVLADAITACEQIVTGTANAILRPSSNPKFPAKPVVTVGRTQVSFFADGILDH